MISTLNCAKTIGLTIGVGSPYADIAPLAAACFQERTGIETVVLGARELASSGLSHPAALRLLAFDYVSAERIVYFDADWFCLRKWSPFTGQADEVRACRDFILEEEFPLQTYQFDSISFLEEPNDTISSNDRLRYDYLHEVEQFAGINLPYTNWINTGLLVLDKEHHTRWLRKAQELYLGAVGHHEIYFEQPALVKAIECVDVRVRLLPRCLNVLAATEAKWPSSVIGLHLKLKRHQAFLDQVRTGTIINPDDVTAYFTATVD